MEENIASGGRANDIVHYASPLSAATRWQPPGASGRFGVGRADITPPVGIRMRNWGFGNADLSTGVHRALTLTALASTAADGSEMLLLITADLGWWRTVRDEFAIRGAVLDQFGLTAGQVLLHLVHTHAGPSICSEDVELPGGSLVSGLPRAACRGRRGRVPAGG